MSWLEVREGDAPLIVSLPHTGTELPHEVARQLMSPWMARKDADWHVERLYDFVDSMGATTVRTNISRSVIDVNRDPTGISLYPGQATTGLCPTTTFDGENLYRTVEPDAAEIARRTKQYFMPYHEALRRQIGRLHDLYGKVVLYEAHSIRSRIPRLFKGLLPVFNIGTNDDKSCAPELTEAVKAVIDETDLSSAVNGRFKGGWTTRRYGRPLSGVHAIQMELSCRRYLNEPTGPVDMLNWPPAYDEARAAPMRNALRQVLQACLKFALTAEPQPEPEPESNDTAG